MDSLYLSKILNSLWVELETIHSPLINFFLPGADKEYIDKQIRAVHLVVPDEFYVLYGWKNGIADDKIEDNPLITYNLFTLANPISINDSIEIYRFNCIKANYWSKEYFPIFESGLGDYFLFDINKKSVTSGMVMRFSPANPYFQGVISIADSLETCFESILECYRKGVYRFENIEGRKEFVADSKLEFEIWKRKNTDSEYWKVLSP